MAMSLTEEQVRTFRDQGYLVTEGILTDSDLAPIVEEYATWIDCRARQLAAEGSIRELHEDAPFERRTALLYAQTPEISRDMDLMTVRGPATFEFLRNMNLLDAVESLIGPEITCNPIQHIR